MSLATLVMWRDTQAASSSALSSRSSRMRFDSWYTVMYLAIGTSYYVLITSSQVRAKKPTGNDLATAWSRDAKIHSGGGTVLTRLSGGRTWDPKILLNWCYCWRLAGECMYRVGPVRIANVLTSASTRYNDAINLPYSLNNFLFHDPYPLICLGMHVPSARLDNWRTIYIR